MRASSGRWEVRAEQAGSRSWENLSELCSSQLAAGVFVN